MKKWPEIPSRRHSIIVKSSNLRLLGEAVDWTNYTETTLQAKPSCVVAESAKAQTTDLLPPHSTTEEKKSNYSKIKQNLLQRIAEAGTFDDGSTVWSSSTDRIELVSTMPNHKSSSTNVKQAVGRIPNRLVISAPTGTPLELDDHA
ncbi:unnamed protein product [Angiostrongylus costaricensis]|uniref:Uncharacterized protein n=1 Tax=Angiostrongylus costaricensis TaxID=334426 RepID=A0A0R3Q0T9_ANGCS|nr:unnamed protein product [Angiostrongylus costaricensis]